MRNRIAAPANGGYPPGAMQTRIANQVVLQISAQPMYASTVRLAADRGAGLEIRGSLAMGSILARMEPAADAQVNSAWRAAPRKRVHLARVESYSSSND
jgi:hypothetical protein